MPVDRDSSSKSSWHTLFQPKDETGGIENRSAQVETGQMPTACDHQGSNCDCLSYQASEHSGLFRANEVGGAH